MEKKRKINSSGKPMSQTKNRKSISKQTKQDHKNVKKTRKPNIKQNARKKNYDTREINYNKARKKQRDSTNKNLKKKEHKNISENRKLKLDPVEIKLRKIRKEQAKLNKKVEKIKKSKKTGFFRNPKYRKQRTALFYIFIIVSLVFLAMVISTTVFFKIEEITVSGQSNYSHEEIIKQSGIIKGENLFLCNDDQVKENIQKALPYVSDVHVHKTLPNSVEIIVMQALPDAQFEVNGSYIVIDRNSRVLEIRNDKKVGCALLIGSNPISYEISSVVSYQKQDTNKIIDEIISGFNYNNLTNITQIDFTDAFNIKVLYDNRIVIELGNSTEIKYKIDMANTVMSDSTVVSETKGTLDVSAAWDDNKVYFKPDYN